MGIPRATQKIADFTGVTTSTVTVPASMLPNMGGVRYGAIWCDITAVGSGSGWTVTTKHTWPSGVVTTIHTIGAITGTASSGWMTPNSPFSLVGTGQPFPEITQILLTASTAGTTTSLTGALYLVSCE